MLQVLLINGYEADDRDRITATTAADTLRQNGHTVEHLDLVGMGFESNMSPDERRAYESDEPLIHEHTLASAAAVARADALLFCYPTTTFTVPPIVKGWLERVLVSGVAFVFDDNNKIKPGMTNVRRLGAITTTPHSAASTRRARDLGRRTLMWTLRLNCHRFCRRTYRSLPSGGVDPAEIRAALAKW